jgi:LysM repeat protein
MESQSPQLSVRLLVLLFALFTVFLLVSRPAEAEAPVATIEYVVQPGDTLWEIARVGAPDRSDLRIAVQTIQDLNEITSGIIYPGQVLRVPQN